MQYSLCSSRFKRTHHHHHHLPKQTHLYVSGFWHRGGGSSSKKKKMMMNRKVNLHDGEGCSGLHDAFHTLPGVPGGSGDASALPGAADGAGLAENLRGISDVEKLSLPSFFSLGHQVTSPDGCSIYTHHHHGLRQSSFLDAPAMPMFLQATNPHDQLPLPSGGDGTPSPASTVLYDPPWSVQMELCNQNPVVISSALHWPPDEYGFAPATAGIAGSGACHGGGVEGWMGQSASALLGVGGGVVAGLRRREARGSNSTEKQRRGKMSEKFGVLRSLIPNSGSKHDKASILAEATDYIKELLRTIGELQALVKAKQRRAARWGVKLSTPDAVGGSVESSSAQHSGGGVDPAAGRPLFQAPPPRCSWLRINHKDTSVDVRIVEDDVNIKLVRRSKGAECCLLLVAGALHDLQLELLHLSAAGNVGDSLVLMINSKMEGGSSVHAGAVAKKLVEALEGIP